jgi:bacterioferritin-associated ferredoxin/NifU-like protein involved in Fe-S cluster formation
VATLPPVVFQHFRHPQREGALPGAAVGEVEGRRPDSKLLFYVQVGPDEQVAAGFECRGDRSCIAALSLVASHVHGLPLTRVRALDVEAIGAAYGLAHELVPQLAPAFEALTAALAALDGKPPPFAREGELVCHCLHVRRGRIERAIAEKGACTLDDVRFWTRACSGCRSCRPDVERILERARRLERHRP